MTKLKEATPAELRRLLQAELSPRRLVVRRDHAGALVLRILSEAFEKVEDPTETVEKALGREGLRLPERTLTIFKAPSDLETGDEELFFSEGWLGTPSWGDALLREPEDPRPSDNRNFDAKVVAFWGLKGGVGRSTALAHVAAILGQRARVLAIDLDLDSPALVASLAGSNGHDAGGRIEELVRSAASATPDVDLQRAIQRQLRRSAQARSVDVLGPAIADGPYVLDLLGPLAPASLYRGGQPALRRLVRNAIKASDAELVLIDARSGYCDESAMSVLDLADEVVLFASPAPSTFPSLLPALEALERHRHALGRPALVHHVAGMLPAGEEARDRILAELQATIESSRNQTARALGIIVEGWPEVNIIPVDYAARIVENEGTLLPGVSSGYREIAERILPPPLPANVTSVEEGWVNKVLREARVPMTQAEDEADPEKLAALFTRTPDLENFARQEICLVLGAKGTGKSFLRRMCLDQKELLIQRSGVRALRDVHFIDGYSQARKGRGGHPAITREMLRLLDKSFSGAWRDVWSALALGRVVAQLHDAAPRFLENLPKKQSGQLQRMIEADTANATLTQIQRLVTDPLGLDDAWSRLDRWCESTGKPLVLLFDDLDVALGESADQLKRRDAMILGLIERSDESWMSRRHLSVKIFLREDIFRSVGLQEAAKYASRTVSLSWRPEDIWRFVIRVVAVAAPSFQDHVRERGLNLEKLEDAPEQDWRTALELIWGARLGLSESHTRSTAWAQRRLRDGQDRMFPRAALWLLHYAIEARKVSIARNESPPLLDSRSLRKAMPDVAKERLEELRAESGQDEKERILRLKGFKAYQNESDFLGALERAGENKPIDALAIFKELGLVESSRRRDGTPTVRIVDLYAFAPVLEIEREGRM